MSDNIKAHLWRIVTALLQIWYERGNKFFHTEWRSVPESQGHFTGPCVLVKLLYPTLDLENDAYHLRYAWERRKIKSFLLPTLEKYNVQSHTVTDNTISRPIAIFTKDFYLAGQLENFDNENEEQSRSLIIIDAWFNN